MWPVKFIFRSTLPGLKDGSLSFIPSRLFLTSPLVIFWVFCNTSSQRLSTTACQCMSSSPFHKLYSALEVLQFICCINSRLTDVAYFLLCGRQSVQQTAFVFYCVLIVCRPLVTPYYCRLGDLLCFVFMLAYCMSDLSVYYLFLQTQYFDTVGWVFLACENRLPYNLYCVGGDVKHCSIQSCCLKLKVYCFCSTIAKQSSTWNSQHVKVFMMLNCCLLLTAFELYVTVNNKFTCAMCLPFDAHCCHMGTAIKHPVPDWVKPSFVISDIRAFSLTHSPERRSDWMSKITYDGLTRSGTGCFISVPIMSHMATVNVNVKCGFI